MSSKSKIFSLLFILFISGASLNKIVADNEDAINTSINESITSTIEPIESNKDDVDYSKYHLLRTIHSNKGIITSVGKIDDKLYAVGTSYGDIEIRHIFDHFVKTTLSFDNEGDINEIYTNDGDTLLTLVDNKMSSVVTWKLTQTVLSKVVWDPIIINIFQTQSFHYTSYSLVNNLIILGAGDGSISIIDTTAGYEIKRLSGHKTSVVGLKIINKNILISFCNEGNLVLWDLNLMIMITKIPLNDNATSFALVEESTAAVGYSDGKIEIWDLLNIEKKYFFHAHVGAVTVLNLIDPEILLSGGADGVVQVLKWKESKSIIALQGGKGGVTHAVKLNDKRIATLDTLTQGVLIWGEREL